MSSALITWILLLHSCLALASISFCDYYRHIGVYKPQCDRRNRVKPLLPVRRPEPATSTTTTTTMAPYPRLPLCRGHFHSCMNSDQCEGGSICTSGATNSQCCTSPHSRCPSPTEMNIQCRTANPTNWCYNDADCGGNFDKSQLCCPTGCAYNICHRLSAPVLSPQGNVDFRFSALMMSPDCPDPYEIKINCVVQNPVHWCYQQSDCPSVNSVQPRRCCRTRCGYNACHVRLPSLEWIIA